jgi:hypothetical protein
MTGDNVVVIAPKSLTTAAQRDAFKELMFRFPHVASKQHFAGALANYVLLQAKLCHLHNDADLIERTEVVRAIRNIERFLALPRSTEPPRRKTMAQSDEAGREVVDYELGYDGTFWEK